MPLGLMSSKMTSLLVLVLVCAADSTRADELLRNIGESPDGFSAAELRALADAPAGEAEAQADVAADRERILAAAELLDGRPELAIRRLEVAGMATTDAAARARIAWELIGLGAIEPATKLVGSPLGSPQDHASASCIRAMLALRRSDLAACRKLVDESADSPRRDVVLAELQAAEGDLKSAIESIGQYLRREPFHRTLSARAYRLQAEWLEQVPRDLNSGPGDLYAGYGSAMLAWCLAWPGTDEALQSALVTSRYAILFGHPTEAAALLAEMARRFPDSADLHNLRAYALASIGQFDDAETALKTAEANTRSANDSNIYRLATPGAGQLLSVL